MVVAGDQALFPSGPGRYSAGARRAAAARYRRVRLMLLPFSAPPRAICGGTFYDRKLRGFPTGFGSDGLRGIRRSMGVPALPSSSRACLRGPADIGLKPGTTRLSPKAPIARLRQGGRPSLPFFFFGHLLMAGGIGFWEAGLQREGRQAVRQFVSSAGWRDKRGCGEGFRNGG